MSLLLRRLSLVLVGVLAGISVGAPLTAQTSSGQQSPALPQQLPKTEDLAGELRTRIQESGLTPDQIHARLTATGYPEELLDPYLPGGDATADSMPTPQVINAASQIGLIDAQTADSLRGTGAIDTLLLARHARTGNDTLAPLDTLTDSSALVGSMRERETNIESRYRRPGMRGVPPYGLPIFGLNIFEHPTSQFQPNLAGPMDANYQLGPGDMLVLILTGNVEISRSLTVTRQGFIVIPQVGEIYVANLTLGQLEDVLYDRLGRVYSGVRRGPSATTHFSINVARLHSNQIYVVGDVTLPGSYQISGAGTALTALYAASGPTPNGSLRKIEILRNGKVVDSLDLYDYLLHGNASHDARLQNGDLVFVPVHGPEVKVTGEVIRPAIYEIKPGESLPDALQDAGGFTPLASRRSVQITRILPPAERQADGRDRTVINLESPEFVTGFGPPEPLQAGDSIAVTAVPMRIRNRIMVQGDVWTPGTQGFTVGERLSDAVKLAGGLKPDAYLATVLVTRLDEDSVYSELRTSFRDSAGNPVDDLPLHEDDEIRVFALREFRPSRYVSIDGAVRHGGRFPFREGMTLRDLVLLADGLQDGADLRESEIARLPENRAGGVTATTLRVPLDSTYLLDRGPDGKYLGPPSVTTSGTPTPDVVLRPYDNVVIFRQTGWHLQRSVVLAGEVRSPGRYTLTSDHERLSNVLTRAGGLTPDAYAGGIMFKRSQDRIGRIGIDLPQALHNPRSQDNVILEDGDSINIPRYTGVVEVKGEVNAPATFPYVPGADINYYIRAAGGLSYRAEGGGAYVMQPNGKIESTSHFLFFADHPDPLPGSTVYVPHKDFTAHPVDSIALYGLLAEVIGSLATIVIVARQH